MGESRRPSGKEDVSNSAPLRTSAHEKGDVENQWSRSPSPWKAHSPRWVGQAHSIEADEKECVEVRKNSISESEREGPQRGAEVNCVLHPPESLAEVH